MAPGFGPELRREQPNDFEQPFEITPVDALTVAIMAGIATTSVLVIIDLCLSTT
jgi:hypothetical protein